MLMANLRRGSVIQVISHSATSLTIAGRQPLAQGKSSVLKRQTAIFLTIQINSFPQRSIFFKKKCLCLAKYIFLPGFLPQPQSFSFVKGLFALCPSLFLVGHLLQRELKAFLCLLCHQGLFNNYANKVNNKAHDATPLFTAGPQPSPLGLMNGAIRHASCPGGEQAAPAGQPGHRARGRKWSRAERGRAGPACQNSH